MSELDYNDAEFIGLLESTVVNILDEAPYMVLIDYLEERESKLANDIRVMLQHNIRFRKTLKRGIFGIYDTVYILGKASNNYASSWYDLISYGVPYRGLNPKLSLGYNFLRKVDENHDVLESYTPEERELILQGYEVKNV